MNAKSCTRQIIVVVVWVTAIVLSTQVNAQSPRMMVTSSGEIISGGPILEDAKRAMVERINQQSGGKITLLTFQPKKTKLANVDLKENSYCEFGFEAQIKFAEPCRWEIGRAHV